MMHEHQYLKVMGRIPALVLALFFGLAGGLGAGSETLESGADQTVELEEVLLQSHTSLRKQPSLRLFVVDARQASICSNTGYPAEPLAFESASRNGIGRPLNL